MRLVLLGLPAAGKGTQGELLADHFNVPHISTGGIFRGEIESESDLGRQAKAFMDRGELVPDDLSIALVRVRLQAPDCSEGFILDGFPRSVPQAQALDRVLPELGIALDAAINIQITETEAIRRIADRLVCQQCGATYSRQWKEIVESGACRDCGGPLVQRADDTEETARNRLRVYLEQTHPVVDYYRSRGILISIDGQRPVNEVFEAIVAALADNGVWNPSTGVGR